MRVWNPLLAQAPRIYSSPGKLSHLSDAPFPSGSSAGAPGATGLHGEPKTIRSQAPPDRVYVSS